MHYLLPCMCLNALIKLFPLGCIHNVSIYSYLCNAKRYLYSILSKNMPSIMLKAKRNGSWHTALLTWLTLTLLLIRSRWPSTLLTKRCFPVTTAPDAKLVIVSRGSKKTQIEVKTTEMCLKRYSGGFDHIWPDVSCDDQTRRCHRRSGLFWKCVSRNEIPVLN